MNKEEHKGTYGRHYVVVVGYDDNNIKIRNPLGFKEDIPTQEFYKRRNLNLKYLSLHKSSESGIKDMIKENMFPEHQKRRDYVINKYEIPEDQQTNALLENLIIREYLAKPRSAIFIEPKT